MNQEIYLIKYPTCKIPSPRNFQPVKYLVQEIYFLKYLDNNTVRRVTPEVLSSTNFFITDVGLTGLRIKSVWDS